LVDIKSAEAKGTVGTRNDGVVNVTLYWVKGIAGRGLLK
jgi:hypothetical protein